MNRYISLLRGINVSGQKIIKMAELAQGYRDWGFTDVSTYLASGNVLFTSPKGPGECRQIIEQAISQRFGYQVDCLVLTPQQLSAIRASMPFAAERVFYSFIIGDGEWPPPPEDISIIKPFAAEGDDLAAEPGVVYFHCLGSFGKSKLSNNFIEKKLGVRATTRNAKTVEALLQRT